MGRWAQVKCDCENRLPVEGSDWLHRPHREKVRLTEQQRADVEYWRQVQESMYACGHREGLILEFDPGPILWLGRAIRQTKNLRAIQRFRTFVLVAHPESYGENEELLLSPADALRWLDEADELEASSRGHSQGLSHICSALMEHLQAEAERDRSSLAERRRNFPHLWPIRPEESLSPLKAASREFHGALVATRRLSDAAIRTGNPVEMLW